MQMQSKKNVDEFSVQETLQLKFAGTDLPQLVRSQAISLGMEIG